ncbi:MAG TPA: SGNH/GDSL hydrolase family protein [Methylomirabilota bacterium]|nr:SGNH/GDSL hydrolase family protein [Methylomirabilota bacterium]
MMQRVLVVLLGALLLQSSIVHAQAPFALANKRRVILLGDSITYADRFGVYLEAAIISRFPQWQGEIINRGVPSETASGGSEPTHIPARPHVLTRLHTSVSALNPDYVVICYGMNDGLYQPHSQAIQTQFQDGMLLLLNEIIGPARSDILVVTPPPFDARRFRNLSATGPYDYTRPAPNYDQTLQRFSNWLLSLSVPRTRVVDIHTALAQHLALRTTTEPGFHLAADGIHPNATGHWLIAQALLMVWNFPAVVSEARIDARTRQPATRNVTNVRAAPDGSLTFDWLSPLPLPVDPEVDGTSLELAQTRNLLGRQTLQVGNLRTNEYILTVDGQRILGFSGAQLGKGIPLQHIEQWPQQEKSRELLNLVSQRRRIAQDLWVASETHPRFSDMKPANPGTQAQLAALNQRIRALATPKPMRIELRPIGQRIPGDTNLPPSAVTNQFFTNRVAPLVVPTR